MKRRDFLALAGATAAWPVAARAQQSAPGMRRLGFLVSVAETDPGASRYVAALRAGLATQGWVEGKNLTIDFRFGSSVADAQKFAQQLIDLKPDVLVSTGPNNATALANATKTIPIVFAQVVNSVGTAIIGNLAHPVGNATGFLNFNDSTISGKWLELLKELKPDLKRAGILYAAITMQFLPAFDTAAKTLGVQAVHLDLDSIPDVVSALADFAAQPGSGVVIPSGDATYIFPIRQQLYVAIARLRLPVVWGHILFAIDGAPVVYAVDTLKLIEGGGEYAGRVLNGEKIANLPAQLPLMYSLIINLKTAKAMGMTIPQSLIIRADQLVE